MGSLDSSLQKVLYPVSKAVLFILPVILVLSGCSCQPPPDCNVVLIVIDTLRSDHLPFYGYPLNFAPFLNDLSNRSAVFQNAFSASSWTASATASILTSYYPHQHRVFMGLLATRYAQEVNSEITLDRVPQSLETMAEILQSKGYSTFGISDNINISRLQGFHQGFDFFETHQYKDASHINDRIENWKEKISASSRYFLYIHYNDPHAPYHRRKPWFIPGTGERENAIAAYNSEIRFLDRHIEELYESFQWEDDTLLIVTADHGEGLWDHGFRGHGSSLFREQIQVPLLIRMPNQKKKKQIVINVSTLDILPTVLDILGIPQAHRSFSGVSLFPLIRGRSAPFPPSRPVFSHLKIHVKTKTSNLFTSEWRSVIQGPWHYLWQLPDRELLFALDIDSPEKTNRAGSKKKITEQMKTHALQFLNQTRGFQQERIRHHLNREEIEHLESLGYIK